MNSTYVRWRLAIATKPPLDRIDIEGKSLALNLTFRQPLILKPTREFALGVSASHQQSQTFIQVETFHTKSLQSNALPHHLFSYCIFTH